MMPKKQPTLCRMSHTAKGEPEKEAGGGYSCMRY